MDDTDDRETLEARLDRLEATLDDLRATVAEDERVDADGVEVDSRPGRRAERAARQFTEKVAVPAAVAALEANVRVLTYLQDRLREYEDREPGAAGPTGPAEVSERALDRIDDALAGLEDAIEEADLPRNAEARRLLRRARDLNDEVRERAAARSDAARDDGPTVVEIDVEEELDQLRDEVADEGDEPTDA